MLRYLVLLIPVLLLHFTVRGQTLVVSVNKMNVVYVGIDNPLTIAADGYPCESVQVSCPDANLFRKDGCHYLLKPHNEGLTEIHIKVKTKSGLKFIGKKRMRVKRLPDARAVMAGKSSGPIPVAAFIAQKGLNMIYDTEPLEQKWRVIRFRVVFVRKVGEPVEIDNGGSLFTEAVKQEMNRSNTGDFIIFENIKAVSPDGRECSINSMTFTLN